MVCYFYCDAPADIKVYGKDCSLIRQLFKLKTEAITTASPQRATGTAVWAAPNAVRAPAETRAMAPKGIVIQKSCKNAWPA